MACLIDIHILFTQLGYIIIIIPKRIALIVRFAARFLKLTERNRCYNGAQIYNCVTVLVQWAL